MKTIPAKYEIPVLCFELEGSVAGRFEQCRDGPGCSGQHRSGLAAEQHRRLAAGFIREHGDQNICHAIAVLIGDDAQPDAKLCAGRTVLPAPEDLPIGTTQGLDQAGRSHTTARRGHDDIRQSIAVHIWVGRHRPTEPVRPGTPPQLGPGCAAVHHDFVAGGFPEDHLRPPISGEVGLSPSCGTQPRYAHGHHDETSQLCKDFHCDSGSSRVRARVWTRVFVSRTENNWLVKHKPMKIRNFFLGPICRGFGSIPALPAVTALPPLCSRSRLWAGLCRPVVCSPSRVCQRGFQARTCTRSSGTTRGPRNALPRSARPAQIHTHTPGRVARQPCRARRWRWRRTHRVSQETPAPTQETWAGRTNTRADQRRLCPAPPARAAATAAGTTTAPPSRSGPPSKQSGP